MKNGMLKRRLVSLLMAMILTGSLAVTGIRNLDAGADVVQAADGATDGTTAFHVEHLVYVDDYTIPVCNQTEYEDYLFAGWYSNELCTEDQILTSSELTSGSPYYAKFIPADVLSVKCQVPADIASTDTSTNLRVITTLDSDMYSDVGFEFYKYDASTEEYTHLTTYKYSDSEENKLYKKIVANEGGVVYSYSANIFDISSIAYFTGTVTGIKQTLFDTPILIKPFLMTKNGTQVYGVSRCIRISDSYNGYVTVPVYMNSDRDLGTGTVTVTPRPFANTTDTTSDVTYVDYVPGDSRNALTNVTCENNVVTLNVSNETVSQANGLLATLRYKSASNTWTDKAPRYSFDIQSESAEAEDLSNLANDSKGGAVTLVGRNDDKADNVSNYSQEILATTTGYGNHFQIPFRSSTGASGFSVMLKGTGNFTSVTYTVKDSSNTTLGSGTALTSSTTDWTTLEVSTLNTGKIWSDAAYITFMIMVDDTYKITNTDSDARVYIDNFYVTGDTTGNDFEVVDVFHRNTQASGTTPYTDWYDAADTKEKRSNTYVLATLPEFYGFQQLSYGSDANTTPQIFTGETIMLASDLVLNTDHANYLNWATTAPTNKWLGIGCFYNSVQYAFDGTFDGQGHDIYGVYMDGAQDTQGTKNGRGFFNRAAGTIKNFRLRNSCIIGQAGMVGSIVGLVYTASATTATSKQLNLEGVYSNAYVKSSAANAVVGGLVGTRNIPVSFNNCQFAGVNNGSFNTNYRSDGGLLGAIDSNTNKVTVTNCAVTGEIKREGNKTAAATITGGTGGIVGKITVANAPLSVEGCYINFTTDDTSTIAGAVVQRTNNTYSATVKNVLNDTNLKFAASIDLGNATGDVCEGLLTGSATTSETWKAEGFFDATYWDVSGDVPVLKSFQDIQ